ncbi:MAG: hypothetical protein KOO62_10275 [candidate division Zixibacteria bacterium]|nr:hypothetical protein [candidate division Zixibacteria bacterium]
MSPERTKIGVDCHDGVYHVARVVHGQGRPSVQALVRYERSHLNGHHLLKDGDVVMAVPDDRVIVKKLHLETAGGIDLDTRARFEMAQSLLDDESDYSFDFVDTGLENWQLALAVRLQTVLDDIINPFSHVAGLSTVPTGLARAAGLGYGYLTFCHPHGGELICLVDEADGLASICFVLNQSIVGLSRLNTKQFDLSSRAGREKLAIELKTVINFQLATLFKDRITLPMAALLVSGKQLGDDVMTELGRYFTVPVAKPRFNSGFFAEPNKAAELPLENYLVALGLASDN